MPADEQQTRVLTPTGDRPVPAEGQPAAEPDSPGARWATGTTDEPPAKAATKEHDVALAPADAEATPATTDQPTASGPQLLPVRDLPAGLDPGQLTFAAPGSARRGKLRRRLRYLDHVRELLLRDLGGFTYEVHRTAGGTPQEGHRKLAEAKASRIAALDAEAGAIEAQLGATHAETVLREPGIGGTCPECGELHASDARFCARCGLPLDAKARAQREASMAAAAQPTPEPQPASVLWAGGPRPAAGREAEETAQESEVTSRWLLGRDEPTTADRAAQPDEPAEPAEPAADEPAAPDEPAAAGDDPTGSTTTDPPKAAEPGAGDAHATAPDEAASEPAGDPPEQRFEPGPNGRRDEDVRSPLPDPLTSRRGDQGP